MGKFEEILLDGKSMYTKLLLHELSHPHKSKGTLVGCCKCGRTNRTLYKCDEGYICKDCKKVGDYGN